MRLLALVLSLDIGRKGGCEKMAPVERLITERQSWGGGGGGGFGGLAASVTRPLFGR